MAGILLHADVVDETLAAATAETVLQIVAAANHRVLLKALDVSFKSTSSVDTPVLIELGIQTTAGTSSSLTLRKNNPADDETIQTTALQDFSVEPGATTVFWSRRVHPQNSQLVLLPPGFEIPILGGTRVGVRMTSVEGQVACCHAIIEE